MPVLLSGARADGLDMLPNLFFGLALLAFAGLLLALHVRARRASESGELSERDLNFARTQFTRRVQVCVLLALIGAAIIAGPLLTDPLLSLGYWGCVILLVGGVIAFALLDLRGSRTHFETLHEEQAAEFAALRDELAKHLAQAERENLAEQTRSGEA